MDKHADLHAIRFSMSPYKKQDWLTNIPLYGVREMKAWYVKIHATYSPLEKYS